jgi:MoaA/NifB/PqqE/SkfB family radical SAM enzyme
MPDSEWWQLWQHFKEVEIQLSIDGVGSRFEYIRYPGNWSQVESNVAEYVSKQSQITLSVSHTVSAYNIYYLDEFFTWCYNQGLPRPWLGRVHNPAHMRPAVWPAPIRNIIADYLLSSQYDDVKVWGQMIQRSDDSGQFETFKTKLVQHDQFRSLDFRNTFPELAKYL